MSMLSMKVLIIVGAVYHHTGKPMRIVSYSANGSNVDTTICNGKILMENRKLLTVDEGHILSEATRAIAEMKELREAEAEE